MDGGEIVVVRGWLIRPPGNSYDDLNTWIHGIRPSDTEHSPNFDRVWPEVAALIGSRLVVAHNTSFDMSVLRRSAAYWGYEPPPVDFLCSYRLVKSSWPNRWSYRLDDVADEFGIPLDHQRPARRNPPSPQGPRKMTGGLGAEATGARLRACERGPVGER